MLPTRCQLLLVLDLVSTRLGSEVGSKVTGGRVTVPPTCPACTSESSHRPAWSLPSPGAGKRCRRVQESTSCQAAGVRVVSQTRVVTLDSRFVDQNVGEYSPGQEPESQCWSH